MGKHISNKGFMLAEMCLIILALSILSTLFLSVRHISISDYWQFGDAYLLKQSEALLNGRDTIFVQGELHASFNENGNIRAPRTISFGSRRIIIELGGGRLVFR